MAGDASMRARAFLDGEHLSFAEADALWRALKQGDEISLARAVLAQVRQRVGVRDALPEDEAARQKLCQQEALLTSKDPELPARVRHDRALEVLAELDLESLSRARDSEALRDEDRETLGIAGGILKRRWQDRGQLEDLRRAGRYYARGARGALGKDAYTQINAAFVEELLAAAGDDPEGRRKRARTQRQTILAELPEPAADWTDDERWWNAATRAEAHLGLGEYAETTAALARLDAEVRPAPWQLQATARQLAQLAHLREERPLEQPELRRFFTLLLGDSVEAVRSVMIGKVGLALSGGGFRSSFYHLGVLARLAELDVLRHVEVLSCVSGGSIVGACYWLMLRNRLQALAPGEDVDYVELVAELIAHFEAAVGKGLREQLQTSKLKTVWRLLRTKGALDGERTAELLEEYFYRPLLPERTGDAEPIYLDTLRVQPGDHDAATSGDAQFNPTKHNWLRAHKVPALVLNATTVNTGHAWQFTPLWMGESPWSVHEMADAVPRLDWHYYDGGAWRMPLAKAVAASAAVPGIFSPLRLEDAYHDGEGPLVVQLVDGGVFDNQGAAALLAYDCTVALVSDAAGQLGLEHRPGKGVGGLVGFFMRSMSTLMERVRQVSYGDLAARKESGLLRGLMFLHMKEGLEAGAMAPKCANRALEVRRLPLTPAGVRRELQQRLAALRTDLDTFSADESRALMACGYQMAKGAYVRDLARLTELGETPAEATWVFADHLAAICATGEATAEHLRLAKLLDEGAIVKT